MSRQNFHDLLTRYLAGNCTAEEKKMVENWYKMLDTEPPSLSSKELSLIENRLWNKINNGINEACVPQKKLLPISKFYADKRSILAWAAAVIIFVSIGILLFTNQQKMPDFIKSDPVATVYQINKSAGPQKINLTDGSFVILKPGSALTYPKQFAAGKREVFLSGEAYFKISKNPKRPFLVYNNNTITKVVGTSFIIRMDIQTRQTEVSVQTGKVIVIENAKKNLLKTVLNNPASITLIPNQKTTYSATNQQFKTTLVALPLPVYKNNNAFNKATFVFNDMPVAAVLMVLTQVYGIEITSTKEVKQATFTGDLNEMQLYNQLDLICQSIHATYQVSGTKINIK